MLDKFKTENKWYVVGLGTLTLMLVPSLSEMCMAVLFKEISAELELNLVEIGTIWGITPFASLMILFIGGLLVDRYGARRTLIVTCLLGGILGALRGTAWSFTSLTAFAFLLGMFSSITIVAAMKAATTWFSGKKLGVANGILATGMGLGFTIASMFSATVFSPLLGGWRHVLFLYGGIAIVVSLLWFFTVKETGQSNSTRTEGALPLRQSISHVIHIRAVWFLGLTLFGIVGCFRGVLGYLSIYLQNSGWTSTSADGTVAAITGIGTLGSIPLTLLAARIGSIKKTIFPYLIVVIIGVALMSLINGPAIWIIILLVGVGRDGTMALCMTMSTETEGIGKEYSGAAIGLMQSIGRIGPFISPPVGNSLASISPGTPFLLWSAFAFVALMSTFFIKRRNVTSGVESITPNS
jgi:nitrate/nitrite transporter NarK